MEESAARARALARSHLATRDRTRTVYSVTIDTKRWNDPAEPGDGTRVLVSRYRPRGVRREGEPWDVWVPELAPSPALHADTYGKSGPAISWELYTTRYLVEMQASRFWWRSYAEMLRRNESLTLLYSSACTDPGHCHRTLLRALIEREAQDQPRADVGPTVIRRRRV